MHAHLPCDVLARVVPRAQQIALPPQLDHRRLVRWLERSNLHRMPIMPRKLAAVATFALILSAAFWLRARNYSAKPASGDESESAINALTIIQHGVPTDCYLGLPIFENTLTQFSPDDPEYEFRDSSYSRRHVAIYHGWLPLYCMAGSMKLFGIQPDEPADTLAVRHSDREMRRRTLAARFPSLLFGMAFVIIAFLLAREIAGPQAAWAAMVVAAVGRPFVYISREARYHAAAVALGTACCWMIWRAAKHGRYRDFILAGVFFVLLFHTYLISFIVACAASLLVLPFLWRHERAALKLA